MHITPDGGKFVNTPFDAPITQKIRVDNVGQVLAQFHFTPKLQEDVICKPWLTVSPEFGVIPPKESLGA